MRIMLNILFPNQPFNRMTKEGTAGKTIMEILEETRPESVYFTEQNGQRSAVLVVEMADASKVPVLAEPWFLAFDAQVEFRVAMTPGDLQKAGLEELGKKWG